jgi:hypothetical protein
MTKGLSCPLDTTTRYFGTGFDRGDSSSPLDPIERVGVRYLPLHSHPKSTAADLITTAEIVPTSASCPSAGKDRYHSCHYPEYDHRGRG